VQWKVWVETISALSSGRVLLLIFWLLCCELGVRCCCTARAQCGQWWTSRMGVNDVC